MFVTGGDVVCPAFVAERCKIHVHCIVLLDKLSKESKQIQKIGYVLGR